LCNSESAKRVKLADLASRTALSRVFECRPSHPSLNQAGANCINTNVSLLKLVRRSFCDGIHAARKLGETLCVELNDTYAALLALSKRVDLGRNNRQRMGIELTINCSRS